MEIKTCVRLLIAAAITFLCTEVSRAESFNDSQLRNLRELSVVAQVAPALPGASALSKELEEQATAVLFASTSSSRFASRSSRWTRWPCDGHLALHHLPFVRYGRV